MLFFQFSLRDNLVYPYLIWTSINCNNLFLNNLANTIDLFDMKYLQSILSVLLLVCLLAMPYGYYVLIRFIATICFCIFTVQYHDKNKQGLVITFGSLALLFQPFFKVALGRTIWNVVDVLVAIFLIGLVVFESKRMIK